MTEYQKIQFLISKENEKNENKSHFDKGAHQNVNTTLYGKKLNTVYQSKNASYQNKILIERNDFRNRKFGFQIQ